MKRVLYILLTLLIFSCGNVSLETDPIVVETVKDGETLELGENFNIELLKSNDSVIVNPTMIEVEITSLNRSVDEGFIEPIKVEIDLLENPDPTFQITDDFEEGAYSMNITVYENDKIISEYTSEFIVFSGILTGDVSNLYPYKDLYTNSKVILESSIYTDSDIDPFLVWSHDGVVFKEGFLSEGLDTVVWDTGDSYGFINIELQLFPFKLDYTEIRSKNIVDFSFAVNPLTNQLFDSTILSRYLKILYFNGNYIDEVNKELGIQYLGEMNPKVLNDNFGLVIDSETGFTTNDSIFYQRPDDGIFESSSLILDIIPLENRDGNILISQTEGKSFSLESIGGSIFVIFGDGENNSEFNIGNYVLEEPLNIVISFVKNDMGFRVLSYFNNELASDAQWYFESIINEDFVPVESSVSLGALNEEPGFNSILDRFEVYYRDENGDSNIYPDIYKDNIEYSVYNHFNSIVLPENLVGEALADGETLNMEPEAMLRYRESIDAGNDFYIDIEAKGSYILTFYSNEEVYNLTLNDKNRINKKNSILFINNIDRVELPEGMKEINGFEISAIDNLSIDFISLEQMGAIVEEL